VIVDVDRLYFDWLMSSFESPTVGLERVCGMLHENVFQRRVGNDDNRAVDGEAMRRVFLDDYHEADIDPRITNKFMAGACSWFEMLLALAAKLDYLYDGGTQSQFLELIRNLDLGIVTERVATRYDMIDQELVDAACNRVDFNLFDPDGRGGLFPLVKHDHPDQREVEIWDQHAAYFRERLEGVMWTSTN
jgi:hypothetical protein